MRGRQATGFADERGGEVRPAVGVEHGGVEFVVEFGEDGDQALFVDLFACAELFENVVDVGQLELRVELLAFLAAHVDLFGEVAYAGALLFGGLGEGEGLEAASFHVDGPILQSASGCEGPADMDAAGEKTEVSWRFQRDNYEFVVGQYRLV